MRDFYRSAFLSAQARRSRRLVSGNEFDCDKFDTFINVTAESQDAKGNTIVYTESVKFLSNNEGELSRETTKQLLIKELATEEKKEEFLDLLQERHSDYSLVTSVEMKDSSGRSSQEQGDDESSLSTGVVIVIIILGTVVLCGTVVASYFGLAARGRRSEQPTNEKSPEANSVPEGHSFVDEYENASDVGELKVFWV